MPNAKRAFWTVGLKNPTAAPLSAAMQLFKFLVELNLFSIAKIRWFLKRIFTHFVSLKFPYMPTF
jgi:hypothetical protein